jgi:hypothetical protein
LFYRLNYKILTNMSEPKNAVVAMLRSYAKKVAADGSPDRLTTADGQGGISNHTAQSTKDVAEDKLKKFMPENGVNKNASDRVNSIRNAISGANPALTASHNKAAFAPAVVSDKIDLSQDTLAKIASAILSTEAGISFTHGLFEKQAGEAAARQQIQEAVMAAQMFDEGEHMKSAALNDVFSKAAAVYEDLSSIITEDEADQIIKIANIHQEALIELDHPLLKKAYAAGMDDAALMDAADEAEGQEGMLAPDEAIPMGGEELSEEEILALLTEMIQSGEISEEDVVAALQSAEGAAPQG